VIVRTFIMYKEEPDRQLREKKTRPEPPVGSLGTDENILIDASFRPEPALTDAARPPREKGRSKKKHTHTVTNKQ